MAAINAGQAMRSGGNFIINGRTYGVHNGTLFPISGPGLYQLNRAAFKALGVLNKFGNSPQAARIMNNMGLPLADRKAALQVWKTLQ